MIFMDRNLNWDHFPKVENLKKTCKPNVIVIDIRLNGVVRLLGTVIKIKF